MIIKKENINTQDKTVKLITMSPQLAKALDQARKLLRDTKVEYRKYFPEEQKSYLFGHEIEYRWFAYDDLVRMYKEIVYNFVPEELKERYLQEMPDSPLEFIIRNFFIKSDVLPDLDKQKEIKRYTANI